MSMSGVVLKLNREKLHSNGGCYCTSFGWDYIEIIERYVFCTVKRESGDGEKILVPEYYMWVYGWDIGQSKDMQICQISEEELNEEISIGIYSLHAKQH